MSISFGALRSIVVWSVALAALPTPACFSAENPESAAEPAGFKWSWAGGSNAASEKRMNLDNAVEGQFEWSWRGGKKAEATAAAVPETPKAPALDKEAYEKLVKQNLDLRREMESVRQGSEEEKKDKARLEVRARELEREKENLAVSLREMKEKKAGSGEEKQRATMSAANTAAVAAPPEAAPGPSLPPGSAPFRELQRENVELRNATARLKENLEKEQDTQKLLAQRADQALLEMRRLETEKKDLRAKFVETSSATQVEKKQVDRLEKESETLASQVVKLRTEMAEKENNLKRKTRELETLQDELERREHRLRRVEGLAGSAARGGEGLDAMDREAVNMRYNMGILYTEKGMHRAAEREYLQALRMNPSDPDIHYNIGVLYDDYLRDRNKASLHYKKYLQLNPQGIDAEIVRSWLIAIEMTGTGAAARGRPEGRGL